jgi:hypothetical protein
MGAERCRSLPWARSCRHCGRLAGGGRRIKSCFVRNREEERRRGTGQAGRAFSAAIEQLPLRRNVVSPKPFAALTATTSISKGRTQAVRVYTLFLERIEDEQFIVRHSALLQAYRGQDWASARAAIANCRQYDTCLARLYDLYDERIAFFAANPPGCDGAAFSWQTRNRPARDRSCALEHFPLRLHKRSALPSGWTKHWPLRSTTIPAAGSSQGGSRRLSTAVATTVPAVRLPFRQYRTRRSRQSY